MLNIIIASDDEDEVIGQNCTLSYEHLISEVNLDSDNMTLLCGPSCVAQHVENTINSFNQKQFILIAFSHGVEDALISSAASNGYVTTTNANFFATSLVYTNSCMSGVKLKAALADAGCYGYVGYTEIVELPENEDDDIIFIACENRGLTHFLNSDDSLADSVDVMKQYYRSQYEDLKSQNMNVTASSLLHNLGCLTFHDPNGLKRSQLEI